MRATVPRTLSPVPYAMAGWNIGPLSAILFSRMEGTGKFVGRRWAAKVELLPGEFEVFTRPARVGRRSGKLVFTNQRFIWWPSFKPKPSADDILVIPHERVQSCRLARPWQRLFLERAMGVRLRNGETVKFIMRDAPSMLPTVLDFLSRGRYRPGELFTDHNH